MNFLPQRSQSTQRYIFLLSLFFSSCSSGHHQDYGALQDDLVTSLSNDEKNGSAPRIHGRGLAETIDACIQNETYDSDRLERIGLTCLEDAMQKEKTEDVLIGLYAIKVAQNEQVEHFASDVVQSQDPYVQLAGLQVLGSYLTDESSSAIEMALKSDYLLIRLEAAYILAQRKLPRAYPQIESLFMKAPEEARGFFPGLFALEASQASLHMLKKMIHDLDQQVRKEAIFHVALSGIEELAADIKFYAEDIHPVIQEVFAFGCERFQLRECIPQLKKIMQKSTSLQALTSAYSLYTLGDESGLSFIEKEAEKNNLYAIQLLGKIPGYRQDLLYEKLQNIDQEVQLNASLALLDRKDPASLQTLVHVLQETISTFALKVEYSEGKTISCMRLVPITEHQLKENPYLLQISKSIRQEIVGKSLELPEHNFLEFCEFIFASCQHDLVPMVCSLLENLHSEKAFHLLRVQSERLGDPFIRTFCNVILYRTFNDEKYAAKIKEYVEGNQKEKLIKVMPSLPAIEQPVAKNPYTLTLDERTELLIECYSTLAMKQDKEGIKTLLLAIRNAHPAHRPIIAALLLRASQ